jgi:hypothetical protein
VEILQELTGDLVLSTELARLLDKPHSAVVAMITQFVPVVDPTVVIAPALPSHVSTRRIRVTSGLPFLSAARRSHAQQAAATNLATPTKKALLSSPAPASAMAPSSTAAQPLTSRDIGAGVAAMSEISDTNAFAVGDASDQQDDSDATHGRPVAQSTDLNALLSSLESTSTAIRYLLQHQKPG